MQCDERHPHGSLDPHVLVSLGEHAAKRLLDLPDELLLEIASYLLVPGVIRIYSKETINHLMGCKARKETYRFTTQQTTGVPKIAYIGINLGLILVDQRLSGIASQVFYGRNIFHVQSGKAACTMDYFDGLAPHHRAMIRKVELYITFDDFRLEKPRPPLLMIDTFVTTPLRHRYMFDRDTHLWRTIFETKLLAIGDFGAANHLKVILTELLW